MSPPRSLLLLLVCTDLILGSFYEGCQHHCACNLKKGIIDCSGKPLTRLPPAETLPHNATTFLFNHNSIDYVDTEYFQHFQDLRVIFGSSNKLTAPFLLPANLRQLDLSYNCLRSVKGFFRKGVTYNKLIKINLRVNKISHLESGAFSNMSQLQLLDLSQNSVEVIGVEGISHLPNLSSLDISSNNLKTLTKWMLVSVGNCQEGFFTVDLRLNSIGELTADTLDLPCLAQLKLLQNHIPKVDYQAFALLPRLVFLDLSQNEIQHLEKDTFKSQKDFYYLNLSENRLKVLDGTPFQKGTSILKLDLFNNSIFDLETLLETVQVKILDVSSNHIKELPAELLNRPFLREIHAAYNRVAAVRAATFRYLTNLEVLNLIGNNITTFEDSAFSDLKKVKEIYLQDNPLHSLPRSAFAFSSPSSTAIYLNCSVARELPPFSNTTHIYCVTKATNLTLKVPFMSAGYLSAKGYVCQRTCCRDSTTGSALCTQCSIGTYGDASLLNQKSCSPCPRGGFYQDRTGQNKCLSCGKGKYVPSKGGSSAADCIVCPTGTNTTDEAYYRACFCLDNHYRFNRFGKCYVCAENGQKCSNDYLSVEVGYWMSWNISNQYSGTQLENEYVHFVETLLVQGDDYTATEYAKPFPQIHRCPIQGSCNGVDGGQKTRIRESDMCSKGYKGTLCAICEPSYYSWFNKCYECPAAWRTALQLFGIVVLVSVVILLLYFAARAQKKGKQSLVDHIAAKIKIVVGFGQVMAGVVQALAHIPWPKVLLSFGQYLKIIELNVIAVAAPSCLAKSLRLNALTTPLFTTSCQAVIICIIWTYYGIRYRALPKFCKRGSVTERNASSAQLSCLQKTWWLLFVCYPATTAQIVAVLPYKPWTCLNICLSSDKNEPFCKWFLKADLSLECKYDDSPWKSVWIICWSLTIYVVGLPILLYIGLYYKHKRFERTASEDSDDEPSDQFAAHLPVSFRDNVVHSLHFLNENYEPKFWYWEVVEITRKFVLTCGIQFFGQDSHSGVAVAAILANVFLLLHAQFQPIKRRSEHWLQLLSLFVISLNLMFGTLLVLSQAISSQKDSSTSLDQYVYSGILVAINGLFVLYILGKIVIQFIWSCRKVKESRQKCQFYNFLVYFLSGE